MILKRQCNYAAVQILLPPQIRIQKVYLSVPLLSISFCAAIAMVFRSYQGKIDAQAGTVRKLAKPRDKNGSQGGDEAFPHPL